MSIWNDRRFINSVSTRLRNFKTVNTDTYNFSCPYCGDSEKKKWKARAYIYLKFNKFRFHCHNCGYDTGFDWFLRDTAPDLYSTYVMDTFLNSGTQSVPLIPSETKTISEKNKIPSCLIPMSKLSTDHEAMKYMVGRGVPRDKIRDLYFIESMTSLEDVWIKYFGKFPDEPRVAFPFFNQTGGFIGVSARAIRKTQQRYIIARDDGDDPAIFGLPKIDHWRPIFVLEGAIDSLFVENSVAASGIALNKISNIIPKDNTVLILDNQPRNREVVKKLRGFIESGYKVLIWPSSIQCKDVNDCVLAKIPLDFIQNNIFSGLEAQIRFDNWRRI